MLLLVVIGLAVADVTVPAVIIFTALVALFAYGAVAGIRRHPYGVLFVG